ncbi:hypothetical protein D1BOALGB6SA_5136 [Olavius sp. associated proteobacterium Delta 1]|nr:hypothetical protein D1BOALGB6SA_5136 [Olavius sp. associated proteobacterium Delta 1]
MNAITSPPIEHYYAPALYLNAAIAISSFQRKQCKIFTRSVKILTIQVVNL